MERSDWDDDGQYPAAPVPPHERAWRHPSEIGQAAWVHSEPPLALGRGLMMATGAIGGLLSLAVVWAMLPAGNSGSGVTVLSTVAGARPTSELSQLTNAPTTVTAPARTTSTAVDTTVPPSSLPALDPTTSAEPSTTEAPPVKSVTTIQVHRQTSIDQVPAIAVALGDGTLVVTTARAVGNDNSVMLSDGASQSSAAKVVMLDSVSGVAVLSPDTTAVAESFPVAVASAAGDHVRVLMDAPVDITLAANPDGSLSLGPWSGEVPPEGTPVVDDAGALVGLFSLGDQGAELIRLDNVPAVISQIRPAPLTVWLGIAFNSALDAPLAVTGVDAGSPALTAGLQAADVITAVDGKAVASVTDVETVLRKHQPGEVIVLSVSRAGTQLSVNVTLAARPSM